jgi:uncharacterized Tic20 family protein
MKELLSLRNIRISIVGTVLWLFFCGKLYFNYEEPKPIYLILPIVLFIISLTIFFVEKNKKVISQKKTLLNTITIVLYMFLMLINSLLLIVLSALIFKV